MEKLLVVGAGAHAKVVVDLLQQSQEYEIAGLVDSNPEAGFWGYKVIGNDDCLPRIYLSGVNKAVIAIGNNYVRKKLFERVREIGFDIVNVISKNAVISPRATIGQGVVIMPGAIINADTVIGDGCIINTNASVDHDNMIGNFTHIAPGAAIAGSVSIGELCFCGCGCRVIDKIEIGHHVTVGAGAVVISSVESSNTVIGVPAKYK